MKISDAGIDLIIQFEGMRLKAYPDPGTKAAPWTIGYGHINGVKEGDVCTEEEATNWLANDLHRAETCIQQSVSYPLTENEFSALVSFVFNVGCGNFLGSTLLKLLNDGRIDECGPQFERWNHANGVVLDGLTKRRKAEAALFQA